MISSTSFLNTNMPAWSFALGSCADGSALESSPAAAGCGVSLLTGAALTGAVFAAGAGAVVPGFAGTGACATADETMAARARLIMKCELKPLKRDETIEFLVPLKMKSRQKSRDFRPNIGQNCEQET